MSSVTQLICVKIGRMLKRDYEGQNCSIARALEIVGERWTLLIIRDVFLGLRKFDEIQEDLGIARNILTDRLNRLVEEGTLERVHYGEHAKRYEYRLTKKGLDLNIALTALRQWGDEYLSESPPTPPPEDGQEGGRSRSRGERNTGPACRRSRDRPRSRRDSRRLTRSAPRTRGERCRGVRSRATGRPEWSRRG